jgi:DNA polymerase-3 subunit delta'
LEEPPPGALLILIGTSPARQLPTIRSRSQIVRFFPLERDTVAEILLQQGLIDNRQDAARAAELSDGSVAQALQWADADMREFRQLLLAELGSPAFDPIRLARAVQACVDEAGKEPARRRDRLRLIIHFAIEFYRGKLHAERTASAETIVSALDACLSAVEHVDRNVNQATLIAWWLGELSASPVAAR